MCTHTACRHRVAVASSSRWPIGIHVHSHSVPPPGGSSVVIPMPIGIQVQSHSVPPPGGSSVVIPMPIGIQRQEARPASPSRRESRSEPSCSMLSTLSKRNRHPRKAGLPLPSTLWAPTSVGETKKIRHPVPRISRHPVLDTQPSFRIPPSLATCVHAGPDLLYDSRRSISTRSNQRSNL